MLAVFLVFLLSCTTLGAYIDKPYYPLSTIKNAVNYESSVVVKRGKAPPHTLSDLEVKEMVFEALELAEFKSLLTNEVETILLKPNIVEPFESGSGVITDYRVVEYTASYIYKTRPDISIIVGEGAGGWVPEGYQWGAFPGAKATDGFLIAGYRDMLTRLKNIYPEIKIQLIDINIPLEEMVEVKPKMPLSEETYFIHKAVHDADLYVSIPVLKMIETCQVTLGIKNNVGLAAGVIYGWSKNRGFPYTNNSGGLRHIYSIIDEEIVDLLQVKVPDFTIIDGIVGMEQDKTHARRGIKKQANLIIAGKDPVATDSAACILMGVNPRDVEHITLAYYLGLGSMNPLIIGDSLDGLSRWIKPDPKYSPRGYFGQGARIFELTSDGKTYTPPILFMDTLINPWVIGDAKTYTLKTGVTLTQDENLEMWVGSDTTIMISIDDNMIYKHTGRRKHELPNDMVPLFLKAGEHEIKITLTQKGSFSLSLVESLPKELHDSKRYAGTTPLSLKWRWED